MFIDYVLYDLAKNNKRAGNLRLTWNTSTTVFDETSTIDMCWLIVGLREKMY